MPTKTNKSTKTKTTRKPGRKMSTNSKATGPTPNFSQSPYGTKFKNAINRGTPCWTAISKIAANAGKTPKTVCNSLFKAGCVDRCKFNGQWIYWPTFKAPKASATTTKNCQINMWQHFVDWCMATGYCKPEQLSNNASSQKAFMTFCRKFWNKQFNGAAGSTTTKSRTGSSKPATRNYKFPQTGTRRVRRAA